MTTAPQCPWLRDARWKHQSRSLSRGRIRLRGAAGALEKLWPSPCAAGRGLQAFIGPGMGGMTSGPAFHRAPGLPRRLLRAGENRAEGRKPSHYSLWAPMRTRAAPARDKRTLKKKKKGDRSLGAAINGR